VKNTKIYFIEKDEKAKFEKAKLTDPKRISERKSIERRPSDTERRKSPGAQDSSPKRQSKLDRFVTKTGERTGAAESGSKLDDISAKLAKRKEEGSPKELPVIKKSRRDSASLPAESESSRPIRSSRIKKVQEKAAEEKAAEKAERDEEERTKRRSDEKLKTRKEDHKPKVNLFDLKLGTNTFRVSISSFYFDFEF